MGKEYNLLTFKHKFIEHRIMSRIGQMHRPTDVVKWPPKVPFHYLNSVGDYRFEVGNLEKSKMGDDTKFDENPSVM